MIELRRLDRVLIKRTNPGWLDWYGHWWIEIDGVESYGWWPERRPVAAMAALRGLPGSLNGPRTAGLAPGSRDRRHGEEADHAFHPLVAVDAWDTEVLEAVRRFASAHRGGWAWRPWGRPPNCRTFQLDLMSAAGLFEPPGYAHTHGGCPALSWSRARSRRCGLWLRTGVRPVTPRQWLSARRTRSDLRVGVQRPAGTGGEPSSCPSKPLPQPQDSRRPESPQGCGGARGHRRLPVGSTNCRGMSPVNRSERGEQDGA